eukprot:PhF_6_TR26234/c0_g1_i1/m.37444
MDNKLLILPVIQHVLRDEGVLPDPCRTVNPSAVYGLPMPRPTTTQHKQSPAPRRAVTARSRSVTLATLDNSNGSSKFVEPKFDWPQRKVVPHMPPPPQTARNGVVRHNLQTITDVALKSLGKMNERRENYTLNFDLNPLSVPMLEIKSVDGVYTVLDEVTVNPGQLGVVCSLLSRDPSITTLDLSSIESLDSFVVHALHATIQKNEKIENIIFKENSSNSLKPGDYALLMLAARINKETNKAKWENIQDRKRQEREEKKRQEAAAEALRLRRLALVHRSQRDQISTVETKRRVLLYEAERLRIQSILQSHIEDMQHAQDETFVRENEEELQRFACESHEQVDRASFEMLELRVFASIGKKCVDERNVLNAKLREIENIKSDERKKIIIEEIEERIKLRGLREVDWKEVLVQLEQSEKAIQKIIDARERVAKEAALALERKRQEKIAFDNMCLQKQQAAVLEEQSKRKAIDLENTVETDALLRSMRVSADDAQKKFHSRRAREAKEAEIARIDSKLPKISIKRENGELISTSTFLLEMSWEATPVRVFPPLTLSIEMETSKELTEQMKEKKTEIMTGEIAVTVRAAENRVGDALCLLCPEASSSDESQQGLVKLPNGSLVLKGKPIAKITSITESHKNRRQSTILGDNSSTLKIEMLHGVNGEGVEALLSSVGYKNVSLTGAHDFVNVNLNVHVTVSIHASFRASAFSDNIHSKKCHTEGSLTGKLIPPLCVIPEQRMMPTVEYLEGYPPVQVIPNFILYLEGHTLHEHALPPPPGTVDPHPSLGGLQITITFQRGLTRDDRVIFLDSSERLNLEKKGDDLYHVMLHSHHVATILGYSVDKQATNDNMYITFTESSHANLSVLFLLLRSLYFKCVSDDPDEGIRVIETSLFWHPPHSSKIRSCVRVLAVEDPLTINLLPKKDAAYRVGPANISPSLESYVPFEALYLTPNAVVTDIDTGLFKGGYLEVRILDDPPQGDCLGLRNSENSIFTLNEETSEILYNGECVGTVESGFLQMCEKSSHHPVLKINFHHGSPPSFASHSGLQSLFRAVCFFTANPSACGIRRVQYTLLLGEHNNPTAPRRYNPTVPFLATFTFLVAEPIFSLDVPTINPIVYKEGSGSVQISNSWIVKENQTGRVVEGGYLTVEIVEGFTPEEDFLEIREPYALSERSALDPTDSLSGFAPSVLLSPRSRGRNLQELAEETQRAMFNNVDRSAAAVICSFQSQAFDLISCFDQLDFGVIQTEPYGFGIRFSDINEIPLSPSSPTATPSKKKQNAKFRTPKFTGKVSDYPITLLTRANLQHLLRHIQYQMKSAHPKCTRKVILFTASDGNFGVTHIPIEVNIECVDDVTEIHRSTVGPTKYRQGTQLDDNGFGVLKDCTLVDPDTFHFHGGFLNVNLDSGGFGGFDQFKLFTRAQQTSLSRNPKYVFEERSDANGDTNVYLVETLEGSERVSCDLLVGSTTTVVGDKCCLKISLASKETPGVADITIEMVEALMHCVSYKNLAPPQKLKNVTSRTITVTVNPGPPAADGKLTFSLLVNPPLIYLPDRTVTTLKFKEKQEPLQVFQKVNITLPDNNLHRSGFLRVEIQDSEPEEDHLLNEEVALPNAMKKSFTLNPRSNVLQYGKDNLVGTMSHNTNTKFEVLFDTNCKASTKMIATLIRGFQFSNNSSDPAPYPRSIVLSMSEDDEENACSIHIDIVVESVDNETEILLGDYQPMYVRQSVPIPIALTATVIDVDTPVFQEGSRLEVEGSRADILRVANFNTRCGGIWCDSSQIYYGQDVIGLFEKRRPESGSESEKGASVSSMEEKKVSTGNFAQSASANFKSVIAVQKARRHLTHEDRFSKNEFNFLSIKLVDCPLLQLQELIRSITFQNDDSLLEKVVKKQVRLCVRGGPNVKATKVPLTVDILPPLMDCGTQEINFLPQRDVEVFPLMKIFKPLRSMVLEVIPTNGQEARLPFEICFGDPHNADVRVFREFAKIHDQEAAEIVAINDETHAYVFSPELTLQDLNLLMKSLVLRPNAITNKAITVETKQKVQLRVRAELSEHAYTEQCAT